MPLTDELSQPSARGIVADFKPTSFNALDEAAKLAGNFALQAQKGKVTGGLKRDIGALVVEGEGLDRVLANQQAEIDQVSTDIANAGTNPEIDVIATEEMTQLKNNLQREKNRLIQDALTPAEYKTRVGRLTKAAFQDYPGLRNEINQVALDVGGVSNAINYGIKSLLDGADAEAKQLATLQNTERKRMVGEMEKAGIFVPPSASFGDISTEFTKKMPRYYSAIETKNRLEEQKVLNTQDFREWANVSYETDQHSITGIVDNTPFGDENALANSRATLLRMKADYQQRASSSATNKEESDRIILPLITLVDNALTAIDPSTKQEDRTAIKESLKSESWLKMNRHTDGGIAALENMKNVLGDTAFAKSKFSAFIQKVAQRMDNYNIMSNSGDLNPSQVFGPDGRDRNVTDFKVMSRDVPQEHIPAYARGVHATYGDVWRNVMSGASPEITDTALAQIYQLYSQPFMSSASTFLTPQQRAVLQASSANGVDSVQALQDTFTKRFKDNQFTFSVGKDGVLDVKPVVPFKVGSDNSAMFNRLKLIVNDKIGALANTIGQDKDALLEDILQTTEATPVVKQSGEIDTSVSDAPEKKDQTRTIQESVDPNAEDTSEEVPPDQQTDLPSDKPIQEIIAEAKAQAKTEEDKKIIELLEGFSTESKLGKPDFSSPLEKLKKHFSTDKFTSLPDGVHVDDTGRIIQIKEGQLVDLEDVQP